MTETREFPSCIRFADMERALETSGPYANDMEDIP